MNLKKSIWSLSLVAFVAASCIEHEVIPPPKPQVELECSFTATIQGEDYDLVEQVQGFFCDPTQAKILNPSPQPSFVTYFASIRSQEQLDYLQIKLGRLQFNADMQPDPSVENFQNFCMSNVNPNFAEGANGGVEIVFRDNLSQVWTSYPASTQPQSFVFTAMNLESDDDNDYMKFIATFTCYLYNNLDNPSAGDSILVENGIYRGYFKHK
jgi:hypothetical protein